MENSSNTEAISSNGLTFRFAQESDSEAFSKWALDNPKIPRKDILSSMKSNNPTSVTLVIEKEGKPVLFAPFYCQLNLCYLGFNPEIVGKDRLRALEALKWVAASFAHFHGIHEVTVQTAKDYPIGQWALKHGFKEEPRQTFKMRVTPINDPEDQHERNTVEK